MIGMLFLRTCTICGSREERVFADSWTGIELCCCCLAELLPETSMSPASEGDDFAARVTERRKDWFDE